MPIFEPTISSNREIARDYCELRFIWPDTVPEPEPGQFVTLRIGDSTVPLLRRPFAISDLRNGESALIYWRRGVGTRLLSAALPGERLNMMGPLGRGWPAPAPDRTPVLVAGGIGMGPLFFFAETLWRKGVDARLLLGARDTAHMPQLPLFNAGPTRLTTDDGSTGERGTVVELLESELGELESEPEVFACGPRGMLSAVNRLTAAAGVPLWVSMEQQMGCGVGACLGCAIRVTTGSGYARVCTEGPVFPAEEVLW